MLSRKIGRKEGVGMRGNLSYSIVGGMGLQCPQDQVFTSDGVKATDNFRDITQSRGISSIVCLTHPSPTPMVSRYFAYTS